MGLHSTHGERAGSGGSGAGRPVGRTGWAGAVAAPVGVLVGLVLSLVVLRLVVVPKVGFPGDLRRVAAIARHTDRPFTDRPTLVLVSNSAGVEGLDASAMLEAAVSAGLSGWRIENLCVNGSEVYTVQVLTGKVMSARPRAVLWLVRPELIGTPLPLNPQLARCLAYTGYREHTPWLPDGPYPEGLPAESLEGLRATRGEIELSLRTAPLQQLNDVAREKLTKGYRRGEPSDFVAPFELVDDLRGARLERNLREVSATIAGRVGGEGDRAGWRLIESWAASVRGAGVRPIVVIAPSHPGIAGAAGPAERELARLLAGAAADGSLGWLDASGVLGAEQFADAMHPNAAGRARLSGWLGERLPGVLGQAAAGAPGAR